MEFDILQPPYFSLNFDDYKLLGIIGFAQGATVYKAKHLPNDITVAIKNR